MGDLVGWDGTSGWDGVRPAGAVRGPVGVGAMEVRWGSPVWGRSMGVR